MLWLLETILKGKYLSILSLKTLLNYLDIYLPHNICVITARDLFIESLPDIPGTGVGTGNPTVKNIQLPALYMPGIYAGRGVGWGGWQRSNNE